MLHALPPPDPPAVVVTGTALPQPDADRALMVETIERDRLADSPSRQLDEILKQVPGLQLFRRSDSTSAHPTSQGLTMRALGGNAASRALLVFDGVPQSDPFGGWVSWPAFDPAGLSSVRIVHGGGIVGYGPGALAGLIELDSLASPGTNGSLEAGSRESLAARGYFGAAAGDGLLTVNAHALRSRGFVPVTSATRGPVDGRAPYERAGVRARWVGPLAGDVEIQANGLAFIDERERGVPFTGNRTRGADASLRLVGSGGWQWSATAYAQWRNFRSSFASVDEERTSAERVALQDSVPSRGMGASIELRPPAGREIELRFGADARFTTGESREFYAFVQGEPTRRRIAGGDSATAGGFAEVAWNRGPLMLTGGARIDRWTISDGSLIEVPLATGIPTRDDRYDSRSGGRPTARAGAVLDAGGGFELRSAAYIAWRLPTLNELFRPFRVGADATAANAFLDPERVAGAEAGVRFRRGAASFSLTAFANRLDDAIANVTLGQGPGIFPGVGFVAGDYRQRRNVESVRVRGLEAVGELRRGAWRFRASGSYSDAEVEASGEAAALDGLRPAQTPRVTLSGEVGWSDRGRSVSLVVRHVGAQFEDDLNQLRLPAATTFDAFVAIPLSNRLQLVARGENLLDSRVVATLGSDGVVERAAPRTLWIGFRLGERVR